MNHFLPISSTRTSVSRPTRLMLFAGVWLLAGTVRGEDSPKAPPSGPVLNLFDGGIVPGSLADSDRSGTVRWKSDLFASPFDFAVEGVQSIRFPSPEKPPRPTGAFGFELTGGDILFGSIVGLDDKVAELEVAKLGRLSVDRSRVRRIFRWRDGADLVYNGPTGLTGWRDIPIVKRRVTQPGQQGRIGIAFAGAAPQPPAEKTPKPAVPTGPNWSDDGGQLHTSKEGAAIQGDVGLPARASLEIELSWKQKPDFVLAIGVSDDEKSVERAFRFEVWDGQLVVLRELDKEGDVVPVQAVNDGPGRAQLQLFLDQELGKLLVFSASGELVADLKLGGHPGPALTGVRLSNLHGDLRLERLRVGRWDGETPRPLGADQSRVQLTDMSVSRGQVDRLDPTSREFVVKGESGETRLAEDKVSNIFLARPDENAARTIRAVYQDGTRLGGEWVKVEGGSLVLTSPGIAGSLRLPMDGLRSLDVLQHNSKPKDVTSMGTLEMDGLRMLGRLVDSAERPGEGILVWQPLAGETSSPIRKRRAPRAGSCIGHRRPLPSRPRPRLPAPRSSET